MTTSAHSPIAAFCRILGFAFAAAVLGRAAAAQAAPAASVDATIRQAVVDSVTSQVERLYVDSNTGRMIADGVRSRLRAAVDDTLRDPVRFAARLSLDLRAVNGDLHLGVVYRPGGGFSPFSRAMATAEPLAGIGDRR